MASQIRFAVGTAAYLDPPASQTVDAPAAVFSADRAMAHVEVLSAAPRPVGSAGHVVTRDYLMAELQRLGLAPAIQETVSAFRFPGAEGFSAARVDRRGDPTKKVLF